MKKCVAGTALAAAVVMMSVCFASQAFAWGSATHAYISDHLGKGDTNPLQNLNEIYGSMAADTFNYMFNTPDRLWYLYSLSHYNGTDSADKNVGFISVWRLARTRLEKAAAFGFVTHNGQTGADRTAHGLPYGDPSGFVIQKASQMAGAVATALEAQDIFLDAGALNELCHTFIESAIDIKIIEMNPALGLKISCAALARTPDFPDLLADAYAQAFSHRFAMDPDEARGVIHMVESEFRKSMVSYGLALTQKNAKDLVAEQLAALAPGFLNAYQPGVALPQHPVLVDLSTQLLLLAYTDFIDGYSAVVDDTIKFVRKNLAPSGIRY